MSMGWLIDPVDQAALGAVWVCVRDMLVTLHRWTMNDCCQNVS
jgi:hypothetical protein